MGRRSIDAQFNELRDMLLPLACGFADFDNHAKTPSEVVGMATSRIASVEQTVNALSAKMASFAALELNVSTLTENVNSLTARICKIETNATSVSSGSDSARSWNILGHSNGSSAAGSLGSQGHLMTVEIRGVDLIRSQAPKMNKHEVPSYYGSFANNTTKGVRSGLNIFWKNPICQHSTNLSEFIVRQVLCRSGLYLKHESNVETFLAREEDDGIPYAIDSPFCCTNTNIIVRQSKSIEDREIGRQFALFLERIDARSQVLSIKDRRNGVGKPVFKFASLGSGQTFTFVAPEVSVPGISLEVLQRVLAQANRVNV